MKKENKILELSISLANNQLLIPHIMSKITSAQNGPKIKNAQNLSKFDTFDFSNIPISILMSKVIFLSNIYQLLDPNWS